MGTEDAAEAQKKAPKRNPASDDDEDYSMLLGYGSTKTQTKDAVVIKAPTTRLPRGLRPSSRAFRPMNTLSMHSSLPSPTQNSRRNELHNKKQTLAVDVIRGFNVPESQFEGADEKLNDHHSVKKQKLVHPNSASSISSESIDEIPADNLRFRGQSGKDLIAAQRSKVPAPTIEVPSGFGMASEFGGVDNMMNPSLKNSKRKKGSRLRNGTLPLMNSFLKTDPVEVGSDDDQITVTKIAKKGHPDKTMKNQNSELPRTNGTGNDHKVPGKTHSPYFRLRSEHSHPSTEDEQNLSSKFVASNGSRRGIQDHLSSDELDGPATIGKHADVVPISPGARRQAVSPTRLPSITKLSESPTEQLVEPSNIRPTVFAPQTQSKRKAADYQEDFDKEYLTREAFSWTVPIAAISLPGQELHTSSDMKLVFDKDNGVYFVIESGTPLKVSGSHLEFLPRSLQKIWWEKSGKKVRFESSKRGTADHILDLELESEKDLICLMKKLQVESNLVKLIGEDSDKIQRKFENRRKQQFRPTQPPISGFEGMDEDVQMVALNQQRRQSKAQINGQETSNSSRQRSSRLGNNAHGTSNGSSSVDPPAKDPRQNKLVDRLEPAKVDTAKPPGRSKFFEKYKPAHNDHIPVRRSERTSTSSFKTYLDTSPERLETKAKKYSVEVGLGEKWSRALSYPKEGKKKTTIEWEDLVRLDEDEFLNDNLVSFYMRYLEQEFTAKSPELAKTVYFFNSFFYDRLTTSQKGQRGINYEGVQRWTRGVDLFAYDYVIVPINELAHWYVAIICNLPVLGQGEDFSKENPSAPKVENVTALNPSAGEDAAPEPQEKQTRQSFAELSLEGKLHERQPSEDSLVGRAPSPKEMEPAINVDEDHEMLDVPIAIKNPTESAKPSNIEKPELLEHADEDPAPNTPNRKPKRKSFPPTITKRDPLSPVIITFDSFGHAHSNVIRVLKQYLFEEGNVKKSMEFDVGKIKGITAKNIPQQKNFSDCGLYMLGYVEKFLEDHPKDFIGKIIKREYDDRKDWPKMNPSDMRNSLREQLQKLHEEDEADRIAKRRAQRSSGTRNADSSPPTAEQDPKNVADTASNVQPEGREGAMPKPEKRETVEEPPMNVQQIRNERYDPSSAIQDEKDEKSSLAVEPLKATIVADTTSEPTQENSLIVVDSHDQTSSALKVGSMEIPSSQLHQPLQPNEGSQRASPVLPAEIADSQNLRQQTSDADRAAPPQILEERTQETRKVLGELPPQLGPLDLDPTEEEGNPMLFELEDKKETEPQSMVYTDWKPAPEDRNKASPAASSSPRPGRKGVAQKKPTPPKRQQQPRGKKMTKEDAIVLD